MAIHSEKKRIAILIAEIVIAVCPWNFWLHRKNVWV